MKQKVFIIRKYIDQYTAIEKLPTGDIKKLKGLDGIEEDEPSEEEIRIIQLYKSGDDEYQPYITHEEIKKQFGIK